VAHNKQFYKQPAGEGRAFSRSILSSQFKLRPLRGNSPHSWIAGVSAGQRRHRPFPGMGASVDPASVISTTVSGCTQCTARRTSGIRTRCCVASEPRGARSAMSTISQCAAAICPVNCKLPTPEFHLRLASRATACRPLAARLRRAATRTAGLPSRKARMRASKSSVSTGKNPIDASSCRIRRSSSAGST